VAADYKIADIGDQPRRGTEAAEDDPTVQCELRSATTLEIVVVLGMHRSGTSLCMSLLQALGVRLDDDLIPGDANNEAGYFESRELIELNEGIFRTVGATWHTLFSLTMPDGWADDSALLPAKKALRDLINRKVNGPASWGFKDPRTAVLLPFYEQVFAECGLQPRYILCIRDPRAIALSLKKRNQFPSLLSELLWLDYTMPAIQLAGNRLQAIVVYEKWFQDAIGQAESLVRAVGLGAGVVPLDAIVQRVVAPALNHADALAEDYELACSRSVYELLLEGDLNRAAAVFAETWQAIRLGMGPAAPLGGNGAAVHAASNPHNGERKQRMQPNGRIMNQVFWRSEGNEFEEAASARAFTDAGDGRRSVRLAIPGALGPRPQLRLDPADVPGIAQLFGIKLLYPDSAVAWEWDGLPATLAGMERRHVVVLERVDEAGVFLYLPTSDPSILLPVCAELDKLSETGGSLELDFAWRGTIYSMFD
jgi:hypothetical protein